MAARAEADTRKPVAGSTVRAVELAELMKVMAPSCRASEPVGPPAGAYAVLSAGDPGSHIIHGWYSVLLNLLVLLNLQSVCFVESAIC